VDPGADGCADGLIWRNAPEQIADQAGGHGTRPAWSRARAPRCRSSHSSRSIDKREIEILRLIDGGYSNREIAEALGTAEGTVKNHASSILSKLGVRDRTRAVLKALELGYI
jgi:DNA-binding NarL/FixJ family response regulator